MDRPVRQHIRELERRIDQISQEMMQDDKTQTERNRMETELRVAQQALESYEQAIRLEGYLRQS